MAVWGVGSSLRRMAAPAGAMALLGLVLAAPGFAATPTPDPPPLGVAPDPPAAAKPRPVAPVSAARAAPARRAPFVQVRPAPSPAPAATPKPVAKKAPVVRKVPGSVPAPRPPHDRHTVPLATFLVPEGGLDRGLLAVAGFLLLLATFGGSVVLAVARRELRGLVT